MNPDHESSTIGNAVPKGDSDEQQRASRPLKASAAAHRPGRLQVIASNAVPALGGFLLVIACLIPHSLPRFKPTDDQAAPIVQAARAETVVVTARELYREIKNVGKLDYGDGQIVHVTSPIAGCVERVSIHSAGDPIGQGEQLISITSDSLLEAQRDLFEALEAIESKANRDSPGVKFTNDRLWEARRRLLFLGVRRKQLVEIEQSRNVDSRLAVESPTAGILLETRVRIEQQLRQGDVLFRIAKPHPIWLYFNVPVRDLPWVSLGRRVNVDLQTAPAATFPSLVTVVSPSVDPVTQTVRIGIPLPNPEGKLKPSVVANATIRVDMLSDGTPAPTGLEGKFICSTHPEFVQDTPGYCPKAGLLLVHVPPGRPKPATPGKTLAIPISAVLDRDGHKCVRRLTTNGRIEMVEIKVGPMSQGLEESGREATYYPVRAGLKEGERVFLIPIEPQNTGVLAAS